MPRVVISGEYPILIQHFISSEETRYYLQGFYVHPDPVKGVRVVATDGHHLGVFYDEKGLWEGPTDVGMIVKLEAPALGLLREKKSRFQEKPSKWLMIEGTIENNTATILYGDLDQKPAVLGIFRQVLIDGTFPDYSRVVPSLDPKNPVTQSVDPSCLSDIVKVAGTKFGLENRIRIVPSGEGYPMLVLTGRTDFFGVIMPVRAGWEGFNGFPEWWTRAPAPVEVPKPRRGRPPKAKTETPEAVKEPA